MGGGLQKYFRVGLRAEKLNPGGGGRQNPKAEGYNVVDDKNSDEGGGGGGLIGKYQIYIIIVFESKVAHKIFPIFTMCYICTGNMAHT